MAAKRSGRVWLAVLRFTWRMVREHPEVVVAAICRHFSQKVTLV
jgi:hypothetical protein